MTDFDGETYQARFDRLAARGMDVHGEADLVASYSPGSVLDAGCGTGRVAIELARRGIDTVGVDVNRSMLDHARRVAPGLRWVEQDLADLDLGSTFDVVVLAGNVPLFCPPPRRADLISRCASHVIAGGRLIAGFSLDGRYRLEDWDEACVRSGLALALRWSTWDRQPYADGDDYAVSVHEKPT